MSDPGRPVGISKYEPAEKKPTGFAFYTSSNAKSWCYLCRTEHRWAECPKNQEESHAEPQRDT